MHKSHYAQYIQERAGKSIIENENGFATYVELEDGIYIEDIYVVPEKRNAKVASEFGQKIELIAKELGYKKLFGSVATNVNGTTESIKKLINYGFEFYNCNSDMIYFIKEIK